MDSFPACTDDVPPADVRDTVETLDRSGPVMISSAEESRPGFLGALGLDPEICTLPVDPQGVLVDEASPYPAGTEVHFVDNSRGGFDGLAPGPVSRQSETPAIDVTDPRQERTPLVQITDSSRVSTMNKGYDSVETKRKTKSQTKLPHDTEFVQPILGAQETVPAKGRLSGKSTFIQTLLNTLAVLIGMGMLAVPLAFSYAGWCCGTLLVISYGFLTCYTGKILARFMVADPAIRTYADIGQKAFGDNVLHLLGPFLCLELFTSMVGYVTLYADSLEAIAPAHSVTFYKVLGLTIFLPAVFLPLSWLSVTSLLGITSSALLVVVILVDGFTKKIAPGSIWDPLPSHFGISSSQKLGVSFGLFMTGFSTHLTIPSLVLDMDDPKQFERVLNVAYFIATTLYVVVGIAGYRMFGNDVSEEISLDLFATPGYNKLLNRLPLYALIITPLSKFGLVAHPINAIIERIIGLRPRTDHDLHGSGSQIRRHTTLRRFGSIVQRIVLTFVVVATSIVAPGFASITGILGAVFSFLLCVIGPISAKMVLEKKWTKRDIFLSAVAAAMSLWGMFSILYPQQNGLG